MEKKTNNSSDIKTDCAMERDAGEDKVEILSETQAKQKAMEESQQKADEYKDMLQRLQAEFDNYRKRTCENSKLSRQEGVCDVIMELIPAIDNLERGLELIKDNSARNGMEIILKQLLEVLTKFDIKEIEALDKPFNPDVHHAIAKDEECNDSSDNIVSQVFVKGYKRKTKILRPAMVKVSNKN